MTSLALFVMALFVGKISRDCDEDDIRDAFGKYGQITRCALKKGFAFVTFEEQSSADDAMEGLQGQDLRGSCLFIEPAKPRNTDRDGCFKCHKPGHWARDCPEGDSRYGGRDSYRRDDYRDRGDRGYRGDRGGRRDDYRRDSYRRDDYRRDDYRRERDDYRRDDYRRDDYRRSSPPARGDSPPPRSSGGRSPGSPEPRRERSRSPSPLGKRTRDERRSPSPKRARYD